MLKIYLGSIICFHSVFHIKPNLQAICTQTIQFNSGLIFYTVHKQVVCSCRNTMKKYCLWWPPIPFINQIVFYYNYVAHSSFYMSTLILNDGLTNIS